MRIVGGRFRGRAIAGPQSDAIRPTSDRAREAIFNILVSRSGPDFSGRRVLDLFAGTGAMSLEALSRGADAAVLIDTGIEARALIRDAIDTFGLGGSTRVLKRDACSMGPNEKYAPFDLVFCDPPYSQGLGETALLSAAKGGWLVPGADIVLEERRGQNVDLPQGFELVDQRHYGEAEVRFLTYTGDLG